MAHDDLVSHFEAYSAWRSRLSDNVGDFRNWLNEQELNDAQTDLRIQHLLDRLHDDKLNVAFVAEFSRGKSELINAVFFAVNSRTLILFISFGHIFSDNRFAIPKHFQRLFHLLMHAARIW